MLLLSTPICTALLLKMNNNIDKTLEPQVMCILLWLKHTLYQSRNPQSNLISCLKLL